MTFCHLSEYVSSENKGWKYLFVINHTCNRLFYIVKKMLRPRKYFIYFSFIIIATIYVLFALGYQDDGWNFTWMFTPKISPESIAIRCYSERAVNSLFPLLDEQSVKKTSSIFFVETSCHTTNRSVSLNPRQACAIESAAKLNPNSDVYLLVAAPIEMMQLKEFVNQLMSYDNVKIRHIDMNTYFVNTPLQTWYEVGTLKSSKWPVSHASDVLRFTTLWKFGGTYVDLDVVLLKPFDKLTNFVGAESIEDVAAGFLSLSYQHELANLTIKDLKYNFRGYDWGNNGPGVITRALKNFCDASKVYQMTEENCKGFKVFKPSVFYPIPWREWKDYFVTRAKDVDRVMAKLNESIAIHVWNHHSKNTPVIVNSNQPYSILASRFCPRVYNSIKGTF